MTGVGTGLLSAFDETETNGGAVSDDAEPPLSDKEAGTKGDELGLVEEEEVLGNTEFEFVSLGTVSVSIENEEVVFDAVIASTGVDEANELVSKVTD